VICPQCQGVQLASEFTGSGLVFRCLSADCGCQFKDSPAADVDADDAPVAAAPKRVFVAPVAVAAKPIELSPKDILKLARQRLRELNREIKKLTALKSERDQIKRLLAAANQTTDAQTNVRALRTKTG
jgi:hypothetical protein